MKPEIKQRWVEALRSGKYPQTTGSLKDEDGFCCLGVLTELYRQEDESRGKWASDDVDPGIFITPCSRYGGFLPEPVQEWADLDSEDPIVDDRQLSRLNDGYKPFPEIANYIEKYL